MKRKMLIRISMMSIFFIFSIILTSFKPEMKENLNLKLDRIEGKVNDTQKEFNKINAALNSRTNGRKK